MNIPNQLIVIWAVNNLTPSKTALAIIMGMLIKKEKSNACCFSTPTSKPQASVVPLLENPGKIANPCEIPIYKADFLLTGLLEFFFKSAISNKTAEIKNPQTSEDELKLSSIKLLNNKTITIVGIVAINSFIFVSQNGFFINSFNLCL